MANPYVTSPQAQPAVVNQILLDAVNRLQSIATLSGKVLRVFDVDDFMNKQKGVRSLPVVAVVYEGMRAIPDPPGETSKVGITADCVMAIYVLNDADTIVNTDTKTPTIDLLDQIRGLFLATQGPNNSRRYKFVVEAAAMESHGVVVWVQRWSIPVPLLPRRS
jgi:hypothetical protein